DHDVCPYPENLKYRGSPGWRASPGARDSLWMVLAPESVGCGPNTAPSPDDAQLGVGVLFNRVLDAVVIARLATGRIVLWNAAAEKLFGYTARQAVGQSIEILMPAPIAQIHRNGLERYMRTGHVLIIDA